jgi:hypothetical protein
MQVSSSTGVVSQMLDGAAVHAAVPVKDGLLRLPRDKGPSSGARPGTSPGRGGAWRKRGGEAVAGEMEEAGRRREGDQCWLLGQRGCSVTNFCSCCLSWSCSAAVSEIERLEER